uniref:Protein kinase domain-containing protein n=1 Tax=Chromera velia CCMP2878 TaxID=1169474 RepID=A0A0G4IE78_9ALVE|eukprot:Cvel_13535.t1-p1 / transcript=Cvel_13535.t1 / gene=Cvel_13535 / organism=Chromera_velia_CCMP2878 / gene_product=Probable serine/threonine-protein kinase, putative / transcript_product=Probable serine/threonine-protein kinase, putative / location=Cvel_scaffold929:2686-4122(-) / protein_length=479 / sequence_SO=supercontig / SO=protein_coding / is_pseudo=false
MFVFGVSLICLLSSQAVVEGLAAKGEGRGHSSLLQLEGLQENEEFILFNTTGKERRMKANRPLGKGAYGEVWSAESSDRLTPKLSLAVKEFQSKKEAEKEDRAFSRVEGILHVLQEKGKNLDLQEPLVATDLMKCGDFTQFVRGMQRPECRKVGRLSEQLIALAIYEVLKGLQDMHEKGIAHQDVKPDNILVTLRNGKYSFVLGDLGSSTRVEDETGELYAPKCGSGTPKYFHPGRYPVVKHREQESCNGFANDIWGLGMSGVLACTGQMPKGDLYELGAALQTVSEEWSKNGRLDLSPLFKKEKGSITGDGGQWGSCGPTLTKAIQMLLVPSEWGRSTISTFLLTPFKDLSEGHDPDFVSPDFAHHKNIHDFQCPLKGSLKKTQQCQQTAMKGEGARQWNRYRLNRWCESVYCKEHTKGSKMGECKDTCSRHRTCAGFCEDYRSEKKHTRWVPSQWAKSAQDKLDACLEPCYKAREKW